MGSWQPHVLALLRSTWRPPALALGAAVKAGHVELLDRRPGCVEQLDDQRAWTNCESEATSGVGQLEARCDICES
jgi:hypothetical protein